MIKAQLNIYKDQQIAVVEYCEKEQIPHVMIEEREKLVRYEFTFTAPYQLFHMGVAGGIALASKNFATIFQSNSVINTKQ